MDIKQNDRTAEAIDAMGCLIFFLAEIHKSVEKRGVKCEGEEIAEMIYHRLCEICGEW